MTTAEVRRWLLDFEAEHHHELDEDDELYLSKVRVLIGKFPENLTVKPIPGEDRHPLQAIVTRPVHGADGWHEEPCG